MIEFICGDEAETRALAERVGTLLAPGDVIAFRGGLAAGKTTFTKGLARGLGISANITSPTYTIIQEYPGRLTLYHIDAYRLSGEDDFLALGAEEIIFGQGVCAVEWSERVVHALPSTAILIELEAREDGARHVRITHPRLEGLLR